MKPSKDDTERWCLGRKGRAHKPQMEITADSVGDRSGAYPSFFQIRCIACCKVMGWSFRDAWLWRRDPWERAARFYGPGLPPHSYAYEEFAPAAVYRMWPGHRGGDRT